MVKIRASLPASLRTTASLLGRTLLGATVLAAATSWTVDLERTDLMPAAAWAIRLAGFAILAGGALWLSSLLRNMNAWVECDGRFLRWKSLGSGRVQACPLPDVRDAALGRPARLPLSWPPRCPVVITLADGTSVRVEPECADSLALLEYVERLRRGYLETV